MTEQNEKKESSQEITQPDSNNLEHLGIKFIECLFGTLSDNTKNMAALKDVQANQNEKLNETTSQLVECIRIVRQCQQQTSEFINNKFEKEYLHPAIWAIVKLYREIESIKKSLFAPQTREELLDNFDVIKNNVLISHEAAHNILEDIGINFIEPKIKSPVDPLMHRITEADDTDSRELGGTVGRVFSLGITYKSKVLTQACVCVYRLVKNENVLLKGKEDGNNNENVID